MYSPVGVEPLDDVGALGTAGPTSPREPADTPDDRYVAASGSSWSVAELTSLARECLIDEPED